MYVKYECIFEECYFVILLCKNLKIKKKIKYLTYCDSFCLCTIVEIAKYQSTCFRAYFDAIFSII